MFNIECLAHVPRLVRRALLPIALLAVVPAATSIAARITVTGTGDTIAVDGVVTLREAIASINGGANVNGDVVAVGAYGTGDTINFNIPGAGVRTIAATSTYTVASPVTIDGYTQPGATANTEPAGFNATLLIRLDGASAGSDADGLKLTGGGSAVRGLVITRFRGNGIAVVIFPKDHFRWTQGEELVSTWRKPDADWQKWFCRVCGAPLPGENDATRMFAPRNASSETPSE